MLPAARQRRIEACRDEFAQWLSKWGGVKMNRHASDEADEILSRYI